MLYIRLRIHLRGESGEYIWELVLRKVCFFFLFFCTVMVSACSNNNIEYWEYNEPVLFEPKLDVATVYFIREYSFVNASNPFWISVPDRESSIWLKNASYRGIRLAPKQYTFDSGDSLLTMTLEAGEVYYVQARYAFLGFSRLVRLPEEKALDLILHKKVSYIEPKKPDEEKPAAPRDYL